MRGRLVFPVLIMILIASFAPAAFGKPGNGNGRGNGGGSLVASIEAIEVEGNATLVVVLNASGGDGSFGFHASGDGLPETFALATANGSATTTFSGLVGGEDASLSLDAAAHWRALSSSCSAGAPGYIALEDTATTTCWFVVERLGTLTVHVNATGNRTFAFDGDNLSAFQVPVTNGTGSASVDIVPGTNVTVDLVATPLWSVEDASCEGAFRATVNGTVHCWFELEATDAEIHARIVSLGGDDAFSLRFTDDDETTRHRVETDDGVAWKNFTGLDPDHEFGLRLVVDDDWRVSRSDCREVVLEPGEVRACEFVVTRLGEAQGRVTNATGRGVADVRVYVDLDGDDARDGNEPTDLTNATGYYTIDAIPLGDHSIRVVLEAGCSVSAPSDGERDIEVEAGSLATAQNFRIACASTPPDDDDGEGRGHVGGGPGYWKNWRNHHTDAQVSAWVRAADAMPTGYAETAAGLTQAIRDSEGHCMKDLGKQACRALREDVRELISRLNEVAG